MHPGTPQGSCSTKGTRRVKDSVISHERRKEAGLLLQQTKHIGVIRNRYSVTVNQILCATARHSECKSLFRRFIVSSNQKKNQKNREKSQYQ